MMFFAVWNNISKFDSSKGSFLNWVAAITNYKILTYKKKYYKDFNCVNIDDMSIESDISMEKDIIEKENQEDIQNLISTLKEDDKKILIKLLFNAIALN
ncbi:MAG: hypothetical protein PUE01_03995 [Clostridiaceae bacterium]|nr:hypothetical protein [Clostridiaceae bacterium]